MRCTWRWRTRRTGSVPPWRRIRTCRSGRSWRPRTGRGRPWCTPAMASSPSGHTSPRRWARQGSPSSGPRLRRSRRWETRPPRAGWPMPPACRSCPAHATRSTSTMPSERRRASGTRCWSRRRSAAAARACTWCATRSTSRTRSSARRARRSPISGDPRSSSSATSTGRTTSRPRSSPTHTATSCSWASAIAPCSAGTRS